MPEKEKEILNASFSPVLKFRDENARSVHDLVRLCDSYVGEAQLYLLNGYFEPWLVQIGEVALVNYTRDIWASHSDSPRKGLELFVRECCKSLGANASPILECEPSPIDFGLYR
jgi:hypothetical protein